MRFYRWLRDPKNGRLHTVDPFVMPMMTNVGVHIAPRLDWVYFSVEKTEGYPWVAVERSPVNGVALRARAADTEEEVRSYEAPWQEAVYQ